MVAINPEILFLVRYPHTPPELMFIIMHRNLDDSMNEKISAFDNAEVLCQKAARVVGQNIGPLERSGRTDMRQISVLLATGSAGIWHSPKFGDNAWRAGGVRFPSRTGF